MAKHYRTWIGAQGCYVLMGHNMVIHICARSVDQQGAEELAQLLDQAYELGLIRGNNGHPDAIALRTPTHTVTASPLEGEAVQPCLRQAGSAKACAGPGSLRSQSSPRDDVKEN